MDFSTKFKVTMPTRTDHLLRNHDTRLDGELPATHLEQILQAWSE